MDFVAGAAIGLLVALAVATARRSGWKNALFGRRPPGAAPSGPSSPASLSTRSNQTVAAAMERGGAGDRQTIEIIRPDRLPKFADVGGMAELKKEMLDTVGLVLKHPQQAREYRISWNGLLFHGPPGVGKSYFARSLAGELGLAFLPVQTSDLVTDIVGQGPALVDEAFAVAAKHLPCLLFFDEIDAVASARDDSATGSGREVVTQLLQALEEHRDEPRLLVAAATNDLDALDAAVVRPGRFDRHVRIDLPDEAARIAVFKAHLKGRPVEKDLGLDELSRRTQGRSPASISQACEVAALAAFRQAAGTGRKVRISRTHLLDALGHGGGEDRPTVEHWSWDRLVLPKDTLAELRQIQRLVEDPAASGDLGVDPPTGVLLYGPPGTGKTTIAKVLAAEAASSFYPVSGADVTSQWVGESEKRIARLFRRARANAPSIIFIDEIDALGANRGQLGAYDRQIDQLLQEIDGLGSQPGVLVIGATNRPSALDPALLRGGRLSRKIEIPLPDADARLAILKALTAKMPLDSVDLEEIALETDGMSGADLKALCQQAAMEAMIRQQTGPGRPPAHIKPADFARALEGDANGLHRPSRHRPVRPSRDG